MARVSTNIIETATWNQTPHTTIENIVECEKAVELRGTINWKICSTKTAVVYTTFLSEWKKPLNKSNRLKEQYFRV